MSSQARFLPLWSWLRSNGFQDYRDYLSSPLWREIRLRVFQSRGTKCKVCREAEATQIHHERYTPENLSGKSLADLVPICPACHEFIERNGGVWGGSVRPPKPQRPKKAKPPRAGRKKKQRKPKNAKPDAAPRMTEQVRQWSDRGRKQEKHRIIARGMTPNGGFTREFLASIGVPWPPPKGWKKRFLAS